ncbi:hypothetical protein QA640_48230 (plasmid) [Bradyrhizobium sp. CB82]|uniref:hypothetical protein n=1 Tax=Bradyrhizobium sp. CB82 TaxID=3039159 RepID=UPI0024B16BB9|nr:hypothetical protein [Bradyrhizobium sp. CB82]WFU46148.1 hypothetical protein QA640_48230 [Bradyrhizobium sp. CB82]
MNLSPCWVPFLHNAGFEAVHWSAVGAAEASDRGLMQWPARPWSPAIPTARVRVLPLRSQIAACC